MRGYNAYIYEDYPATQRIFTSPYLLLTCQYTFYLAIMTTQNDGITGSGTKVLTNPKLRTHLHEYGQRRRTDGPYADNLEVDALVVGGGFAGVFMFWALRNEGLKTVM